MRKRLIEEAGVVETAQQRVGATEMWIDLQAVAEVEISSEDKQFPIEQALGAAAEADPSTGWRAATTGPQTIRLRFDRPTAIRRIYLHFVERAAERSQEFAVYAGNAKSELREAGVDLRKPDVDLREIVRQQFTFSPVGATEEIEDYEVDLKEVTVFELRIDPDRAHEPKQSRTYAALLSLRLA
jgi:hypothetical protein